MGGWVCHHLTFSAYCSKCSMDNWWIDLSNDPDQLLIDRSNWSSMMHSGSSIITVLSIIRNDSIYLILVEYRNLDLLSTSWPLKLTDFSFHRFIFPSSLVHIGLTAIIRWNSRILNYCFRVEFSPLKIFKMLCCFH